MSIRGPNTVKYREIPTLTNWRQTDAQDQLRGILQEHERGQFFSSALFVDEMLTDDRIMGCTSTRISGLLCAPLTFTPADDRKKSAKLAKILGGANESVDDGLWWQFADLEAKTMLLKWRIFLGFAIGEITWDTRDGQWLPRVTPWNPRNSRYNFGINRFQLSTNGSDAINQEWNITLPRTDLGEYGDGKWFVWGRPYSWMGGMVRSLGQKYLDRQWNERDWSRYNEKHGLAIVEGKVPAGADNETEKEKFEHDLANLGNEGTIITPQGAEGQPSYGFQLHEAVAKTWETFQARKEALDSDIAIAVLGQNLTTEVKGGSLAAASIHEGIRIDKKKADAELFQELRRQVLIPWADYNYGKGAGHGGVGDKLAPYPTPQIDPPESNESEGNALGLLGDACTKLAPHGADVAAILESHGVPMRDPEEFAAEQAGQAAKATDALAKVQGEKQEPGEEDEELEHDETAQESIAPEAKLRISMLKANGPAALKRVAKYHDAIVARATRNGAKALGADLEAILADIESATSPDDLKRRVYARYKKMKGTAALAETLRRANMLANMLGRADVIKDL